MTKSRNLHVGMDVHKESIDIALADGDGKQVDGEDEEFAHGANATMIASVRKTALHRRIPSYYEFATHRLG